jgi:hypothetical protein
MIALPLNIVRSWSTSVIIVCMTLEKQGMRLRIQGAKADNDISMNRKSPRAQQGGATISDVARESGFSPMTVSRVINGEKNVRETTRLAVIDAVKKLNYSPNLAARTLAGAEQIRIGLLYSNPSAAYLSRFLVGTLEQARLNHVQLIIEDCQADEDAEQAVRTLVASNVDGIIMSPPLCDSEALLNMIDREGLMTVVVANWRPPGNISVIRIDDVEAAATMTRHLLSLGHRRIGFIKGNPKHKASSQRLTGFKAALKDAGITHDPALLVNSPIDRAFRRPNNCSICQNRQPQFLRATMTWQQQQLRLPTDGIWKCRKTLPFVDLTTLILRSRSGLS